MKPTKPGADMGKKKKLPRSGLQTATRVGGKLVNVPNKRPNMKDYTPGGRPPKKPSLLNNMLNATVGPEGIKPGALPELKERQRRESVRNRSDKARK